MRIEGTHKCNSAFKDCDNVYEWMAVVPIHASSPVYEVEKIDKPSGKIIETTDEKHVVKIRCPECHQDNIIDYPRT